MYKLWNDSANGFITWGPPDLNLAKAIVEEVTGKKTSMEDPVQVTEDQVEKIHELYGERNHDPKSVEEKDKEVEVSKADIMLGMTSMYEEMLKRDTENKMALAELYESTLK
ncbi:Uncharacterised protein [Urinicoccus massiliensis]|uniref:Uncharacterized protein n=1 Tax=Urinicoccus massiliensis TaxID=1723382 RepID=A0A8H2M6A6_9FIRM|nr:hypothetical protein [Urinicoccus massiliensis]VFB17184.1 Uncharacterised protein [Urinicoccus massiliensis]